MREGCFNLRVALDYEALGRENILPVGRECGQLVVRGGGRFDRQLRTVGYSAEILCTRGGDRSLALLGQRHGKGLRRKDRLDGGLLFDRHLLRLYDVDTTSN